MAEKKSFWSSIAGLFSGSNPTKAQAEAAEAEAKATARTASEGISSSYEGLFGTYQNISSSGIPITTDRALQASVVCACVDVIARGVSQIPFRLMKKTKSGSREPAEQHPVYGLFSRAPNPYMSEYDFRYTVAQHVALTGNAYIWINRIMGKIVELFPLVPSSVTVVDDADKNDGWKKRYRVTLNNGTFVEIPHEDMWVIRWRAFDGIKGLNPLILAREAIGLSLSGEQMASTIYAKGSALTGYLTTEGKLPDEAREILRSEWRKNYSGTSNAGTVAVLSGNLQYHPLTPSLNAQEAQLIDNRNFQISEICRLFGVQPIMVYHYLNATTYASVEQMFLSHIVHTMSPWYRMIESSANLNLLTESEFRRGYYFKFFEQGMLRGDMSSMSNWFKANIEHGIMTPNECRELLDMNPYPEGDIHLVPLNMATPEGVKKAEEQEMNNNNNNTNGDSNNDDSDNGDENGDEETDRKPSLSED